MMYARSVSLLSDICSLNLPLSTTLAQLTTIDAHYLSAEVGLPEAGWFSAQDLVFGNDALLAEGLARQTLHHPTIKRRTCGSFFIGDYSWHVFATTLAAYFATRRVPDLDPANILLRYCTYAWEEDGESGESERISVRFLSERCAVLPDDPAADHPNTLILPDADALRSWLRTSLEAHLTPLISRIKLVTGLGVQAQWNLVADSCAALFLHVGQALGDPSRGQAEGLAFINAPGSPLKNPNTGYFTVEYAGHCETFRMRGGCCRYYTLPDQEKCSTCVLRSPEERRQRLTDYLTRKYAPIPVGGA
jgi:hypothetical protein